MTLWEFLYWLYSRFLDVVDWFANWYTNAKNTVANVWNWIVDKAWEAYTWARNDAWDWLSDLGRNAWDWFQQARADAWAWVKNAEMWAKSEVDAAKTWLEAKVNKARHDAASWVSQTKTDALAWVAAAKQNVLDHFEGTLQHYRDWVNPLVTRTSALLDLLTSFPANIRSKLAIFADDWFEPAALFFQHPEKFIFDILRPRILEYAEWILAYGLGAEGEDLPSFPLWDKEIKYGKRKRTTTNSN